MLFYAYNTRLILQGKPWFDMTQVNTVLLPTSNDLFVVYLASAGGSYNITVQAAQSVIGRALSIIAVLAAVAVTVIF